MLAEQLAFAKRAVFVAGMAGPTLSEEIDCLVDLNFFCHFDTPLSTVC